MSIDTYNKKRKFSGKTKTREPKGKVKKDIKEKKKIFVIHRHEASHLHWDLRLEIGGVLRSWAVPKEPPMEKGIKRLAIQVEDHPLAYATFEGTIPEGNYGAGTVEIWDKGTFDLKLMNSEKIEFFLHGKKMKGMYLMLKTNYGDKPEKSWLLFKIGEENKYMKD